jgi:hypothetical protein
MGLYEPEVGGGSSPLGPANRINWLVQPTDDAQLSCEIAKM